MSLQPNATERLARARADLRAGLPVLVTTAGAPALLIAAAETVSGARLGLLRALGAAMLTITARRAATLRVQVYDDDLARIPLGAGDPEDLVRAVADPARDLDTPLKGPFRALRGGEIARHRAALRLAKAARLLPAIVAVEAPAGFAAGALTTVSAAEVEAGAALAPVLTPVIAARVPMALAGAGRLHVFRSADGSDEHFAVEVGRPGRDGAPLVRLHSACFTGDVLGSLKCDCGPQLHAALSAMGKAGAGILLYLGQEGRGIGLANKMRAYSLQDQGFDTVEANHRLGFEDDERDFRVGAAILRRLGYTRVRLMTNNPAKVARLERSGITVAQRVPLIAGHTALNAGYLRTKARKSGHLL